MSGGQRAHAGHGTHEEAKIGTKIVRDERAILEYLEDPSARWNAPVDLGTPSIVTYSFLDPTTLPAPEDVFFKVRDTIAFNSKQQAQFRKALKDYEKVTGLKFVEVSGETPSMIEVYGVGGSGLGGFASVPYSTPFETLPGELVMEIGPSGGGNFTDTVWYEILLHEIGHTIGLGHPHEGKFQLATAFDNTSQTQMSYVGAKPTGKLGPIDLKALDTLYAGPMNTKGWTFAARDDGLTIKGSGRADTIFGPLGDNRLSGKAGADWLIGREGDDLLKGGKGSDLLTGLAGRDELKGGKGGDTLEGDWGRDLLKGGKGRDRLEGGAGKDELKGGRGADTFVFDGKNLGRDVVTDFAPGLDEIELKGGTSGARVSDIEGGALLSVVRLNLKVEFEGVTAVELQDALGL